MDLGSYLTGMQKDHKLRQQMFHHLESTDDWLEDKDVVVLDLPPAELIAHIINYFTIPINKLIYPAKSYAVAIIYAHLLNEHFGVNFYTALKDPDLLAGNDPYFVPYDRAKDIYDSVIDHVAVHGYRSELPQVKKTTEYFYREFYLIPNPYFAITDLT